MSKNNVEAAESLMFMARERGCILSLCDKISDKSKAVHRRNLVVGGNLSLSSHCCTKKEKKTVCPPDFLSVGIILESSAYILKNGTSCV